MNTNKVRSLLAFAGANLQSIDTSFTRDNNHSNFRATAANTLDTADYKIRERLGMNPHHNIIAFPNNTDIVPQIKTTTNMLTDNISREERINKLIGKSPATHRQVAIPDKNKELVESIKEALVPVVEQLEDLAILNGLLVQRIEKLIAIVDSDNTPSVEYADNEVVDEAPEEIYNPSVSMAITDDTEEE